MEVKGKRVVVTGAASGIGKALCEAFHKADVKSVVCVDLNIEGANETADSIGGLAVQANVGVEQDIIKVILVGFILLSIVSRAFFDLGVTDFNLITWLGL